VTKIKNVTPSPNVSEGSQFHQPPQVHSCKAHQLPKKRANQFNVNIKTRLLKKKESCGGNKNNFLRPILKNINLYKLNSTTTLEKKIRGWYLFI
jgi:hypothetical protein